MSIFQLLMLGVLGMLMGAVWVGFSRGWTTRRETLAWTLVCLVAALATIWPTATVRIANALGIGRGADLVFYCAVVVMLVGFWMTYIRLRSLRRELTLLVRRLALQEAERDASRPLPEQMATENPTS